MNIFTVWIGNNSYFCYKTQNSNVYTPVLSILLISNEVPFWFVQDSWAVTISTEEQYWYWYWYLTLSNCQICPGDVRPQFLVKAAMATRALVPADFKKLTCLRDKEGGGRDRVERERERECPSSSLLFPIQVGTGSNWSWDTEFQSGEWQGPKHSTHHLLLPGPQWAGRQSQEPEPGTQPRPSTVGCRRHHWALTASWTPAPQLISEMKQSYFPIVTLTEQSFISTGHNIGLIALLNSCLRTWTCQIHQENILSFESTVSCFAGLGACTLGFSN